MSENNMNAIYKIENGYGFYKFIEAVSKVLSEVSFVTQGDSISIQCMDPSRISMIDIRITEGEQSTIDVFHEGKEGYNLEDLAKVLKVIKTDKKSFIIEFHEDKLRIEKKKANGFNTVKTLTALDLNTEDVPLGNLEKIEYPAKVSINKTYIEDMFREIGLYSELVTIGVDAGGISFSESGSIGEGNNVVPRMHLNELECSEPQKGSYSLEFLGILKALLGIVNGNEIMFHLKENHPLKITTEFEELGILFRMWLAPRVEEAEFDDFDDDEDW